MTVTATHTFKTLVGNGSATVFPFDFAAASASELQVSVNGVLQLGGYTASVSSTGTGGAVTFDTPPANGAAVLIESAPDFTQESRFAGEGDFNPATFDKVHDRLTTYALWLKARVAALFPFSFPDAAARNGKFLGFDASGNGVLLSGTGNDAAFRTDVAASTGSSLVGFLQSGTGASATDLRTRGRKVLYASDFPTVQEAVNEAIARGVAELHFNGGTWSFGSVTIAGATNLTIRGGGATVTATGDMSGATDDTNRTALWMFSGACTNVRITGFSFVGDGNTAHKQRLFGYTYGLPPTLTNIEIDHFTATGFMIVGTFPGVQGLSAHHFKIKDTYGETSGQGLGLATELAGATRSRNVRISDFEIDNSTRHGIYINHADFVTIWGAQFRNHRSALFTATSGSNGRAACIVSRSTNVVLIGPEFDQCRDAALIIDQDAAYTVENVTVTAPIFRQTRGRSLGIGRTANSGECRNIRVSGIALETTANWTDPDILLADPQGVTIDGLTVKADVGYSGSHVIIGVSEYLASYCKRLLIRGARGVISGGGSNYLVQLSDGLSASSGGVLELLDNQLDGATRLYLYSPGGTPGACTNSNVRADWNFVQDITTGGTPSVAGYNRFNMAYAAPTNVTNFANGYDGQEIELLFTTVSTLKNTNFVLSGAADFVGSASDVVVMRKMAAAANRWVEKSRSVN
jgi:hypothetical protein